MTVHPVMKGLGVVYSKPFAKEVASIVENEPDARWVMLNDIVRPNFLIACGARTINSTNFIPNTGMWEKLELEEYEEIYNRYAHVAIELTEENSSMELIGMDAIRVKLNYNQLKDMDVDYIVSMVEVEDKAEVSFDEIYNESGIIIYKVVYR